MAGKLTLRYDQVGDILYIDQVPPYAEQDSEEFDNAIVVRLHPTTGEIENLEILFHLARLRSGETVELPVVGFLKLAT